MPRCASDWLVFSESAQAHLPVCSSSWQCGFLSKLTISQVLTDGWIDHWVDSLHSFFPIWNSICTPGVLRPTPLFCLVTWQWLLTFLWSECPDAHSRLGCVFLIARIWNCSWKSSSTFVPWLLGFCIIRQSFSLWFPEMAPFSLLPEHLPYISVYCFLYGVSTGLGMHILPSPYFGHHKSRDNVSFNSDCPGTWDVSQKEF